MIPNPSELETATRAELFRLGQAHGSFSLGAIDQGVDLLLGGVILSDPRHPERVGTCPNVIFESLVENYFDKIEMPNLLTEFDFAPDSYGDVYMGAIEKFAKDQGVDIECDAHIEAFERHLKKE
jgi:hypothetical protein